MKQSMLTTIDNPFNPFTQFDQWFAYDEDKGYNSLSYVARIAKTSIELSDEVNAQTTNDAIDEIVRLNLLGIYRKVTEDE